MDPSRIIDLQEGIANLQIVLAACRPCAFLIGSSLWLGWRQLGDCLKGFESGGLALEEAPRRTGFQDKSADSLMSMVLRDPSWGGDHQISLEKADESRQRDGSLLAPSKLLQEPGSERACDQS